MNFICLTLLREKVYLPSKKSHLDLVNGHFSTQLSAHGPSFAKNVLTGKGVEHRRSKPVPRHKL